MKVFCTENFKNQFEKLVKNNSYASLQQELIDFFFKDNSSILSGVRLNGHAPDPFLKKRLNGSGGFRAYYYIVVRKNRLYLAYVHPKTGKYGMENISDRFKFQLAKEVLEAIKTENVFEMVADIERNTISFCRKAK